MSNALRPLSTGELLDRCFNLYRNNFTLFAGIAILPPLLKLGLDVVKAITMEPVQISPRGVVTVTPGSMNGSYFLLLLVYLFGVVLASGATVYAVSMVHLGNPTSIARSYGAIRPYFLRLVGIFFLILLVMIGLGIPFGFILGLLMSQAPTIISIIVVLGIAGLILVHVYACLSLATAACVVEKTRIVESLKRSMQLTRGARGRIWLVFVLTFAMNLALGFAIGIPAGIIGQKTGSIFLAAIILAVAEFFVSVLVAPIFTVPLVLIYYDQRVKKEAFDLHLMMEAMGEPGPTQAVAAAPIA